MVPSWSDLFLTLQSLSAKEKENVFGRVVRHTPQETTKAGHPPISIWRNKKNSAHRGFLCQTIGALYHRYDLPCRVQFTQSSIGKIEMKTSQYKSIHWDENSQMWQARLVLPVSHPLKGKAYLGTYDTERDANMARENAIKILELAGVK
jgi:hypothetical protein